MEMSQEWQEGDGQGRGGWQGPDVGQRIINVQLRI
jgi:hypothetical protein